MMFLSWFNQLVHRWCLGPSAYRQKAIVSKGCPIAAKWITCKPEKRTTAVLITRGDSMGMDALKEHYRQAGMKSNLSFMLEVAKLVGALLIVLFATTSSAEASIESVVPKSGGTVWTTNFPPGGAFTSAEAACGSMNASSCPVCGSLSYVGVRPNPAYPNYMDCVVFYNPGDGTPGWNTLSGTALSSSNAVCPTPTLNPTIPYVYNIASGMCERTVPDECPAKSTRFNIYPYQCTCNTGYKFDAVGGICVLLRECTIPDLPPITDPDVQLFEDNPNRADTARLTPRMQTALTCLKTAAVAGSPSVGSAYRPPAYNQHLIDVWKKWREFEINENYDQQDCAARKEKIRLHFTTHGLLESQTPVPGSLHTRGEAVDVSINLPPANIDALAAGCHLRRPLPVKDKVHFIYQ
jgi:hypothetical protein